MKKKSRKFSEAKTFLNDRFSLCVSTCSPSSRFTQEFVALKDHFNLKASEWTYLRGYFDCKREGLYKSLYFAYIVNGEMVEYSNATEDQKKIIHSWSGDEAQQNCNHYWINSKGEKTEKPF